MLVWKTFCVRECCAILLLGGQSSRFGGPDKTLLTINGSPVFIHSLAILSNSNYFAKIVIVYRDDQQKEKIMEQCARYTVNVPIEFVHGGKSRQESVLNALLSLNSTPPRYILIHDGARPLITKRNIDDLMLAIKKYRAAILVHKAVDTLVSLVDTKRKYINRSITWHIETPQLFEFDPLLKGYTEAQLSKKILTDDSSAIDQNIEITFVENFTPNPKLTTPADLILIESLLKARGNT